MIQYLSRKQFAERIGVQQTTLSRYNRPDHDAQVGEVRGWLPETVDTWESQRPKHRGR